MPAECSRVVRELFELLAVLCEGCFGACGVFRIESLLKVSVRSAGMARSEMLACVWNVPLVARFDARGTQVSVAMRLMCGRKSLSRHWRETSLPAGQRTLAVVVRSSPSARLLRCHQSHATVREATVRRTRRRQRSAQRRRRSWRRSEVRCLLLVEGDANQLCNKTRGNGYHKGFRSSVEDAGFPI